MTKEPIMIKLQTEEDLNGKIIKEKGNTKCIFYSDDVCRKGDKTRDCLNCARVEYRSLYSLNWNNQEMLQEELKRKEQECEELLKFNNSLVEEHKIIGNDLYKEIKDYRIKLKTKEEECEKKDKDIKFLLEKLDLANNRIQDCEIYWEKEKKNLKQQLDQLKAENKELEKQLELNTANAVVIDMAHRLHQYKQALKEIKEIAESFDEDDEVRALLIQKCEVINEI